MILEAILQDKFSYFKAKERGVAVATAIDDNAEIRNLDARLFEKSTCRYTRYITFVEDKVACWEGECPFEILVGIV